ncbi:MarR family winged helix-turn-helix transcriptional regulator [Phaeobacter italicus]|uniref:MarR family winged helix-turn-helix transcriptional regulator n=1 Tax=Phaeobacter italicus TaxID=481446 RepID=UPI00242EF298|nr:MarR family winged helix-turn-helix transcriptional regulator [Phaeobacter italicus]MCI5099738.1 MarR family winged helix-turn-helix transcriptional regulator [Phaeobacter italicus]
MPKTENCPEVTALLGVFALYWKVDACIDDAPEAPELNRMESHLLIGLDEPRRMGELARRMQTVPSTVTAAADSLELLGLIRRERDPRDRRAWQLVLTPAGQVQRAALQNAAAELFREVSGLSEEETQQFAALSAKIHDNILATETKPSGKE